MRCWIAAVRPFEGVPGSALPGLNNSQFLVRYDLIPLISHSYLGCPRLGENIVTYTTKDGTAHEHDGLEFLALLSAQVTKPYESVTRYFGFYSCRSRGQRKKLAPQPETSESVPSLEPAAKASSSWAACMKRVLEINPLQCPLCKSEMRIVAFIHDTAEIKKFMRSQNIPDFQAPQPLPRAPPDIHDLDYQQYFD